LSSSLCGVFTTTYLKHTMFLRYILLQLFCIYSLCYMQCYFVREICFVLLHQRFSQFVCAVRNMAVFCSSLISCFPGMLFRYCLSDFELVPAALIITGITFVLTLHICCISIERLLYYYYYHHHHHPRYLLYAGYLHLYS
jgi:hypothetical protein